MSGKRETEARAKSSGGWGEVGSADGDRYPKKITGRLGRRTCPCGCRKRSTYLGMANGVALTSGCEMYVRRWVRDGLPARSSRPVPATEETPEP